MRSQEQVVTAAIRLGHGLADLASDIRDVIEAEVPALRRSERVGLAFSAEHWFGPAVLAPASSKQSG